LLLEPLLCCQALLPRPKAALDFRLWGLDAEGYWNSEQNPQPWTRSRAAFWPYEQDRVETFTAIARQSGPLWRQASWRWAFPEPWQAGTDVWALYNREWHWAVVASSSSSGGTAPEATVAVPHIRGSTYLYWVRDASRKLNGRSRWRWPRENIQAMRQDHVRLATSVISASSGSSVGAGAGVSGGVGVGDSHSGTGGRLGGGGSRPSDVGRLTSLPDIEEEDGPEAAQPLKGEVEAGRGEPEAQLTGQRRRAGGGSRLKPHWSKWRHTAAPEWSMQLCMGCDFAVTGVSPLFCCKMCAESPGRHGRMCRRVPWRLPGRTRSLSC